MLKIATFVAVGWFAASPCLAQGIVSTHPPLSPAEAVAVLRGSHSIADYTDRQFAPEDGPRVYVMRGSSTAGPYGEFRRPQEPRRLDGTLLSDPPWFQYAYVGDHGHAARREHVAQSARRARR